MAMLPPSFVHVAAHELEGIVSKLATSRYRSGRCKTRLNTKCFTESELTLLGIDRDRKTGAQRALLAKSERGQLVYAGPAFIALRGEPREDFEARVAKLKQERPVLFFTKSVAAVQQVKCYKTLLRAEADGFYKNRRILKGVVMIDYDEKLWANLDHDAKMRQGQMVFCATKPESGKHTIVIKGVKTGKTLGQVVDGNWRQSTSYTQRVSPAAAPVMKVDPTEEAEADRQND